MKPLLFIGDGGHSEVLLELAKDLGREVVALTGLKPSSAKHGIPHLLEKKALALYRPSQVNLVMGVGSCGVAEIRKKIFEELKKKGYRFETLRHPSAVVSSTAKIGEGSVVMAGAVIQSGVKIGRNVIINTRASVDHHGVIGDHVHVAPGVVLSGAVRVGPGAHLGVGCTVIQGIQIGARSLVGAGSVVVKNVRSGSRVQGVPAAPAKK